MLRRLISLYRKITHIFHAAIPVSPSLISRNNQNCRDWVFAVGYSSPYLNTEKSWIAAEKMAKNNLSKCLEVYLNEIPESGSVEEQINEKAWILAWLHGIVLDRHFDPLENMYYILAGIRTDLIIEAFRCDYK